MTHLIQHFYESFARKDHSSMADCYADSAIFSDPVFPRLDADQARAMWRMFCRPDGDLRIEIAHAELTGDTGKARWIAHYPFPATGRRVVNVIDASFDLQDGKIIRHTDVFDFWKWSRQALGATGLLLGWTPIVRGKVQQVARARLDDFLAKGK